MFRKINPKWVEYNNVYNEGDEGYNPHPKFIANKQSTTNDKKYCLNGTGMPKTLQGWRVELDDAERRLAKITDKFAIEIVKKSIADIKNLIDTILAEQA